jgi:glycerol-3-phosphate acyltransferase PlsX
MVIRGASIAHKRHPDVRFLLFGREQEIAKYLDKKNKLAAVCEIVHCDDVVSGEDKPSTALRQGRQSSMRKAIDAVKEGRAQGVVSAGNTGALMAMAKFVLKTIPGVDRPAIAAFFPTLKGETVMLDLGANVSCDAKNLIDFSIMGCGFARCVVGLEAPRFGLLNVGSEEQKGHEDLHEAAALIRASQSLSHCYHGFVEGNDIANGTVDVIVTDGFTGNVALKASEGTAKLITDYIRQTFRSSLLASLGYFLARGAIQKLRKRLDPRRYNGAIFLGLNGISVKSHGGADALGFANAIGVAIDMHEQGVIERLRQDFAAIAENGVGRKGASK